MPPAEVPYLAITDPAVRERIRAHAIENAVAHGGTARWETVLGKMMALEPALRSERDAAAALTREIVEAVNATPLEELRGILATLPPSRPAPAEGGGVKTPPRLELPALPNAEQGKVVLRFAPFPSGALHLGSARGVFLNDAYRKRYDGKFYVVYDDTVGSEEKRPFLEAYDLIRQDLETVDVVPDAYYYKSDRMELYYRRLPPLFESGKAYVCTCPAETLRENRRTGTACAERDRPLEWHREAWEGMLSGKYAPGEAIVRIKTDMAHPNPAFRDRVLFRISDFEHPRVGKRYRVWPMLEYAFAVDDLELGITHVLRGKDLMMEDMMEQALWSAWGRQGPELIHWGLLSVRDAKISKSKSYAEVMSGVYDGWSDPRTWSFTSLFRRGIRPEAIRSFVLSFGMSLADIEVPAESLYAENRKLLDPVTPRRAFVADPRVVAVEGFPDDLASVSLANHPTREELGRRDVRVQGGRFYLAARDVDQHRGKEFRLKDLVNIELTDDGHARFTSRPNKPIPRVQWVAADGAVPVSLLQVDGSRVEGMGEGSLASVKEGELFQFERVGFVRADPQTPDGPRRFVFGHP